MNLKWNVVAGPDMDSRTGNLLFEREKTNNCDKANSKKISRVPCTMEGKFKGKDNNT